MRGAMTLTRTHPGIEPGGQASGLPHSFRITRDLPPQNSVPLPFTLYPFPFSAAEGAETRTLPEIDIEEKLKSAFSRGWSVIVWNDPVNLMDYVVYVFKAVLKMNEMDASRHMWEVHQKGKSLVARETREKSELIVHRLRGFGLNASLEQEKA